MASLSQRPRKHKWTINEFLDSARDHIGVLIEKLDPLETLAIFSATIILKESIDFTQSSFTKILQASDILFAWSPFKQQFKELGGIAEQAFEDPKIELNEWMISFLCAYFAVRNADKITGSLLSFATSFLK